MSSSRKKVALSIGKEVSPVENYMSEPGHEIFGSLVFTDAVQKQYLSKDVYKKLRATTMRGEPLDSSIADQVAQGMKEWALSHGATHYTHWFIPLTGLGAEKHDSFLEKPSSRASRTPPLSPRVEPVRPSRPGVIPPGTRLPPPSSKKN